MLPGPIGDGSHGLAGPLIVDINIGAHAGICVVLLLVRIETVIVALVFAGHIVRQFVELQALTPHLVLVDGRAEAGEYRVPIMPSVVDRNVPLRDRHFPAHRYDKSVWKHQIRHTDVGVLRIDLAQRHYAKSEIGRFDFDARPRKLAHDFRHRYRRIDRRVTKQLAVTLFGILIVKKTMQKRRVRGIDADLERLQPVAVNHPFESEGVRMRRDEAVETRKIRGRAAAHIREQMPLRSITGYAFWRMLRHKLLSSGSAGVCRHFPSMSNSQPWNAQRNPPSSRRP